MIQWGRGEGSALPLGLWRGKVEGLYVEISKLLAGSQLVRRIRFLPIRWVRLFSSGKGGPLSSKRSCFSLRRAQRL